MIDTSKRVSIGRMPSKGDRCPRENCGVHMTLRAVEHMNVWTCPEGHYEVKESSGAMRVAFMEAPRYEYLNPKRGKRR